jgi:hypothetical protein
MSKEMREQINKVKNWKQSNEYLNESQEYDFNWIPQDFNIKIEFSLNKPNDNSYDDDFEYDDFDEFYETFKMPFSKWVEMTGDSDIENKEFTFENYDETISLIMGYMAIDEPKIYRKLDNFINNNPDVEGVVNVIISTYGNTNLTNKSKKNLVDETLKNIIKNKPSRIDWKTHTTYLEDGSPIIVPKKNRLTWNDLGKDSGDFDFLELFDPSFTYTFPNNKYKQRIISIQDDKYIYGNDTQRKPKNLIFTIEQLYDMYVNNKIGPQILGYSENRPSK